jgi:hypothetical protein
VNDELERIWKEDKILTQLTLTEPVSLEFILTLSSLNIPGQRLIIVFHNLEVVGSRQTIMKLVWFSSASPDIQCNRTLKQVMRVSFQLLYHSSYKNYSVL